MPAKRQSGRDYKDKDILDKGKYLLMKDDALWSGASSKSRSSR